VRCSYTVVPEALKVKSSNGIEIKLHQLWFRRQSTKFNGTAYIVQRAAEAIYSSEGKKKFADL